MTIARIYENCQIYIRENASNRTATINPGSKVTAVDSGSWLECANFGKRLGSGGTGRNSFLFLRQYRTHLE